MITNTHPDRKNPSFLRRLHAANAMHPLLLDAQKSDERPMIFQVDNLRTNRPKDRVFKDW